MRTTRAWIMAGLLMFACSTMVDDASAMARKPSKSERISQGVYGTSDALDVGRVDIADNIIKDTKLLVPPPKSPIKVKEISKTTKDPKTKTQSTTKYVVLPAKMDGTVVKKDSPEYTELLKDRELLKQYMEGEKAWMEYSKKVDKTLLEEESNRLRMIQEIKEKEQTIAKQSKKISALSSYRNIVFGVGGLILLLVAVYVLSLVVRIGTAAASVFS